VRGHEAMITGGFLPGVVWSLVLFLGVGAQELRAGSPNGLQTVVRALDRLFRGQGASPGPRMGSWPFSSPMMC
jgi:hypothetical protein